MTKFGHLQNKEVFNFDDLTDDQWAETDYFDPDLRREFPDVQT